VATIGVQTGPVSDIVRVPERGNTVVAARQWRRLSNSLAFWALVNRRVLSVSNPTGGTARLEGGPYVGRALCGDVEVEIHEKIPGALRALLTYASHGAFRVERLPSTATSLGDLFALLAIQFLDQLGRYIAIGRRFDYVRQKNVGSLVGGRIDVVGTVRLRSRGMGHLLQFERNVASYNVAVNQIAAAALKEVERISKVVALPPATLAKSRGMSLLFTDCLSHATRQQLALLAENCASTERSDLVRDLLLLSAVVLAHHSFDHEPRTAAIVPRAWFVNLERLFESACRTALAVRPRGIGLQERAPAPFLFGLERREHRAYPDLVLQNDRRDRTLAVGDVKYKEWSGSAVPADLYQLLVHAAAFKAGNCFLLYPSDQFEMRALGESVTGTKTWLFSIDVRSIDLDLEKVLDVMNLTGEPDDNVNEG